MANISEQIKDLNELILQGKALEAFEKYYHDEVIMQENDDPATVGKSNNRIREIEFFSSITEFRGANLLKTIVGEEHSMTEWQFDYTHKDWGDKQYTQVAIQEWKDGKIIKEKFYYNS